MNRRWLALRPSTRWMMPRGPETRDPKVTGKCRRSSAQTTGLRMSRDGHCSTNGRDLACLGTYWRPDVSGGGSNPCARSSGMTQPALASYSDDTPELSSCQCGSGYSPINARTAVGAAVRSVDTTAPMPDTTARSIDTAAPTPDTAARSIDTAAPTPDTAARSVDAAAPRPDTAVSSVHPAARRLATLRA